MWSRTRGRSGSCVFSDRGSAVKRKLATWQEGVTWRSTEGVRWRLTSNRSTVDEPVAGLPIALVTANGGGVDHCDGIVPIEGDARVNGSQCELRRARNFCKIIQSRTCGESTVKILTIFRDDLTGSDASKALEVGSEDCSGLEHWDGDRDELCVLEMGFNGFQLELGGLSESDGEYGASNEEGAESHWERKWWKWK